jgi:hypothetical protein
MKLNYVVSAAQSRGRATLTAGMSEAAGSARGWREFIDFDNFGANHRRDDQLRDPIAGIYQDRLLAQIHK